MRGKLTSRVLAALLAVVMVVGLLPMTALAARVIDDDAPMAETAMGEEAVAAPVRAPSKAAEAAEAEEETPAVEYEYVLDTDGIDDGAVYVIVTSRDNNSVDGNKILYYDGSAAQTDQVTPSAMSEDTLSLATGYATERQLWEASAVEGGIALRSLAGEGNKYLKVASDSSHAKVNVSGEPQALTITNGVTKSGCTGYSIVQGSYSLNWNWNSICTWNDASNVLPYRFYKQTPVVTEPETPVEKTKLYFESVAVTEGAWMIGDGTHAANTLEIKNRSSWGTPEEIQSGDDYNYRVWAPGPGYLNFVKVGNNLLSTKKKSIDQAPAEFHVEAQACNAYIIYYAYTENGNTTTYYLTAENQEHDSQTRAVFSPDKADAVPYVIEQNTGATTFSIWCEGPYTVSFTGEGAENIASLEGVYYGTALPDLTREGYTFLGWFDDDGNEYTGVTADVTLTARWEEASEPEEPGKEAPPAALETAYEYRLDTDGLDSGEYGITAPGNNRTVGMHDSGSYTNQCPVTITGAVMTLPHDEHKWTVVQQPNGKYTIQGNGGKYLTSADCTANNVKQLVLGDTPEEFTAAHVGNGSYTVQNAAGKYLAYTDAGSTRWIMSDSASNIQLFKKTAVEPAMAQTKFSGTSDKPMDRLHILNQNDDVDTDYRIPALTTLDNGWIVAACDIRWSSTADSPNNLDTIVSVSKDGGVTWEWEVVNYFSDYAPINGSTKTGSASFIDPAVVQSEEDGSIYLLVDAQAPYVNGGKIGNGFDEQGRLKISKSPVNGSYSMDNLHNNDLHGYTFDYYVDINNAEAGANYTVDGETVKLWPIRANDDDHATGYYVDAFFNTYYDYGEGGMRAVIAQQNESTAYIHNNIFYTQSEWKVFPTAFLMLRKATVNETTGKLDWGEPMLISSQIKYDTEHFIGVCPGRGFTTTVNGKERILFALYDSSTGAEKASVIYSDDGGVTWSRGARVENGETTSNSESQIVELHNADGTPFLRMFSRNPANTEYVSYADSFDSGETWTTTKYDRDMPNGHSTMMSFIGLEGFLVSPEGDVYDDLVLASYPRGDLENVGGAAAHNVRRTNGMVRIGYYDAENEVMVWLNDKDDVRYPYRFTYSCLTQLRDGDGFTDGFALLYEDERTWASDHGMEMGFDTFTSADLLGEGWMLVQAKPDDDHPIITVAPIAEQTYTGEPVEPAVTVKKNGEVMTEGYTVEYSNNTEAGEATVTVTVGEIVVETTFRIVKPDEYTVGAIADRTYTGGAIKPTVVVRKNGKNLSASYYTLEYENNVDVGTATVKVVVGGEVVATGTFQIVADTTTEEPGKEPEEPGKEPEEPGDDPNTPSTPSTPNIPSPSGNRYTPSDEEDLEDLDVPLAGLPTTFVDVRMSDWFCAAAEFVFAKNLMQGVSATEFRPEMNTTRGMVVTILHRMEQEPQADPAAFVDVAGSAWYADAVAWGAANNVVKGVDDGGFHPTDDVTREQLAAFLYRFAEYRGYDVTARGDLSGYTDSGVVSGWAKEAMSWAVGTGLITGKSGDALDPLGAATRAELATILTRFCKAVAEEK